MDTVFNITQNDALVVIDVQNDFLPGGSLAISEGDSVIEPINKIVRIFEVKKSPIFFTRDWHPENHCSFNTQNGPWPAHCVQDTWGAEFNPYLHVPQSAKIISKATSPDKDAYSGFDGTDLIHQMDNLGSISRVFVCGVATDYCVLSTVKDGLAAGKNVFVIEDAIKAVNVKQDDEVNAIKTMKDLGAIFVSSKSIH